MVSDGALALRLLLALALGGLVGLERELRDQPAGFRTHMLVSAGACLFTLVSAYGFTSFEHLSSAEAVRADVTRIASQVVVGIGFLGGGAILREGQTVRGLTTAASLWVTAACGVATGAGMLRLATLTAVLAFLALGILKPFEKRVIDRFRREEGPPSQMPPG